MVHSRIPTTTSAANTLLPSRSLASDMAVVVLTDAGAGCVTLVVAVMFGIHSLYPTRVALVLWGLG